MGFDLYGVNPKIKEGTKKPEEIDWKTSTEEEKEEYFKAVDEYESINKGVYFRNNVWWWRRLADYVCEYTGVVDEKDKKKWQYNDGHQVSKEEAEQIANQLEHLLSTGHTDKYAEQVKKEIEVAEATNAKVQKLFEQLEKKVEEVTGKKELAPAEYPKEYKEEWDRTYSLS